MRICDLREKEVINIKDCCRLGCVCDVDIDCKSGCIVALIVPGPARFCFFGFEWEYVLPWKCICQIGPDIILVDIDPEKDRHKL